MNSETTFIPSLEEADSAAAKPSVSTMQNPFEENAVLSRMLQAIVKEYKDCSPEEIESTYLAEAEKIESKNERFGVIRKTIDIPTKYGGEVCGTLFKAASPGSDHLYDLLISIQVFNKDNPDLPLVGYGSASQLDQVMAQEFRSRPAQSGPKDKPRFRIISILIVLHPEKEQEGSMVVFKTEKKSLYGKGSEDEKSDLGDFAMIWLGKKALSSDVPLIRMLAVLFDEDMEWSEKKRILADEFGIVLENDPLEKTEPEDASPADQM